MGEEESAFETLIDNDLSLLQAAAFLMSILCCACASWWERETKTKTEALRIFKPPLKAPAAFSCGRQHFIVSRVFHPHGSVDHF